MWDPKLNKAYLALAQHYRVAIEPARVRRPKDKAPVETGVRWLETWLLEWLVECGPFISFLELNQTIKERMKVLNERNYTEKARSRESRISLYEKRDLPQMRPLPERPFEVFDIKRGRVSNNYHIEYNSFSYSVPYRLYGNTYELHAYQNSIHIFVENHQVALHQRRYTGRRYVTASEHMPEKDRFFLQMGEKDGSYYRRRARVYGESTVKVVGTILSTYDYEPQGYKSCMGLFSMGEKWGKEVLESACCKAIAIGCPSYSGVSRIIKNRSQDIVVPESIAEESPVPEDLRTNLWRTLNGKGGQL